MHDAGAMLRVNNGVTFFKFHRSDLS
jgi:hypothetical protein